MTLSPDLTSADFLASAQGLLPSGPAWPRDPDAVQTLFWQALADRFEVLHRRCRDLLDREADPTLTAEALVDWERAWGLPDKCSPNFSFARVTEATYFDAAGVLRVAPINQLRYRYDPVTGAQVDTLLEGAATNLVLSSGVITTAAPWSWGSNASDLGAVTGPDGLNNARRVGSISGTGANVYVGLSPRITVLPSTQYTLSAYFKRGAGVGTTGRFLTVDEWNGTTLTRTNGPSIAGQNIGSTWQRVSTTLTTKADTIAIQVYWCEAILTGNAFDFDCAQVETGAVATSFIYTTTVPVVRGEDVYFSRSVAGRRAVLAAKIGARGGQSRQYFIDLAASLGFAITIEEFRPFRTDVSVADTPLNGPPWPFTWRVHAPAQTLALFRTDLSVAGDPLSQAGNTTLECVLSRLAPAHTTVLFVYGS